MVTIERLDAGSLNAAATIIANVDGRTAVTVAVLAFSAPLHLGLVGAIVAGIVARLATGEARR